MKTQHEMLESIPVRRVDWYVDKETERVVLKRPKFMTEWAQKLFRPVLKNDFFAIKLDDIGTVVWENCDGKKTVNEIGRILGKQFGPDMEPVYERLFKFFIQLHKAKMIRFLKADHNNTAI